MSKLRHIRFCFGTVAFLSGLLFAQQPTTPVAKKGAVEGAVINAQSGQPLPNTELTLMRVDLFDRPPRVIRGGDPLPPSPPSILKTTTDPSGKYQFLDVEPGRYSLSAQKSGYGRPEHGPSASLISVSAGETASGMKIELHPHAVITGRVVDEKGKPVPHVLVTPLQEQYIDGRKQLAPISGGGGGSDERGEFRLAGVWTGQVILQLMPNAFFGPTTPTGSTPNTAYVITYYPGTTEVSRAARIDVSPGAQRSGLEARLVEAPAHRVRGQLLDHTGQLPKRCSVGLQLTEPALATMMARVTQAQDGGFEFQQVPPGSYLLIARCDKEYPLYRGSISVGARNIDNLSVRLPRPVKVEGEILVKSDVKVDLRGVYVSLVPGEQGVNDPSRFDRAASDGTQFVLGNVAPGKYQIGASLSNTLPIESIYVESIQYGDQDVTGQQIEITPNPSRIRITINSGTGSATGLVTKNNAPVRAGTILLLSADKSRRLRQQSPKTEWIDANARFAIHGIPPGDYLAFAFEEMEQGFWRDEERFRKFASQAKKVSIGKNAAVDFNLEITPLPN
jgi:hypothetical protein